MENQYNPEKNKDNEFINFDELIKSWENDKYFLSFLDKKYPNGIGGLATAYAIKHPWVILKRWKQEIKWAWQRVFIGFDDRVSWSIDWYLNKNMPFWIERLIKTKQGVPYNMINNCDNTSEEVDIAKERWNIILAQIIDGFKANQKMIDDWNNPERYKWQKQWDEGFALFKKYYNDLWD